MKCFIREVFNLRDVSRSRRLKQSVVGGDCEIKSPFNRSSQLIQLPTPPISPEPWNLITLYPKYFNITIAVSTRGIIVTFLLYLFQVVNECKKSNSSRTDCRRKRAYNKWLYFEPVFNWHNQNLEFTTSNSIKRIKVTKLCSSIHPY